MSYTKTVNAINREKAKLDAINAKLIELQEEAKQLCVPIVLDHPLLSSGISEKELKDGLDKLLAQFQETQ